MVEFGKIFGPATLIFSNLKILFSEESQRRLGVAVLIRRQHWRVVADEVGQLAAELVQVCAAGPQHLEVLDRPHFAERPLGLVPHALRHQRGDLAGHQGIQPRQFGVHRGHGLL